MDTHLAEGIHLIVETEGDDLRITEGDFTPHDKVVLIQYLVSSLSNMSKIPYNDIMDDLKLIDEEDIIDTEIIDEEPITEAKEVKKKKNKKERK